MVATRPTEADQPDRDWQAWMASAQAGDQAAYARLLHACVPFIKSVARHQGVRPESLDDVVQDTLLTIHQSRHTYDPNRSFMAWLRTLAQRRAIDFLRRQGRNAAREVHAPQAYETFPDTKADPSESTARNARVATLARAMTALPARQREAVEYLMINENSLAEAAAATGRKAGALKVSLHRAIKSLRVGLLNGD